MRAVGDAQSAAKIHAANINALRLEFAHQCDNLFEGDPHRGNISNLAADVDVNRDWVDTIRHLCALIHVDSFVPCDAKFVFSAASRDVCMAAGVNVRVHTECHWRCFTKAASDFREALHFRETFHVELVNARF